MDQARDCPRRLRIFVVEDHADTLGCLKHHLESAGHTVFTADCVEEALARVPDSGCELLLSDIGLPDGNGWELLARLRTLHCKPAFSVAMSGYGDSADRGKSASAGFDFHLTKPFRKAELLEVLEKLSTGRTAARGD